MHSQQPARHPSAASKNSSNLAQSQSTSASQNLLVYGPHIHISMASNWISPKSVKHGLPLYLQPHLITAAKFASSLPHQVYFQTCPITISECISKFTPSWPPSISRITLNHCPQLHLQTRLFMALGCMFEFTRLSFSGATCIALKNRLQPVQINHV